VDKTGTYKLHVFTKKPASFILTGCCKLTIMYKAGINPAAFN